MRVSREFSEYKPWSGAVDTYDRIYKEGKLEELEAFLEEHFNSDCVEECEVNDLLWFDEEYILNMLGISEEESEDEE